MATSSSASGSTGSRTPSTSSTPSLSQVQEEVVTAIQLAVRREVQSAVAREVEVAVSRAVALAVPPTPPVIPPTAVSAAARGSSTSTITVSSGATLPSVSTSLLGVSLTSGASYNPPLGSGETSFTPASVIISPSFPPVSGKVAERIRSGSFVEIKELMPDNAALKLQISELGGGLATSSSQAKLREVEDPLSWVFYFLSILAIATMDERAKDLAAYAQVVIHLAQRHGGRGWQAYDRLFRQQAAAGSSLSWREISPPLLASTVFSGARFSCQLCNGADHPQSSCALQSGLLGSSPPEKKSKQLEVCRRYNKGECKLPPEACKFTHACLACGAPHPLTGCSKFRLGQTSSK